MKALLIHLTQLLFFVVKKRRPPQNTDTHTTAKNDTRFKPHTHRGRERNPEDVPYVGLGTISIDHIEAIFSEGAQTW